MHRVVFLPLMITKQALMKPEATALIIFDNALCLPHL